MSEYKQIKTRIWQDKWFLSLNPEEKLLWFFLLTNEYSHISGLFEIPKPLISPFTGVKDPLKILKKFESDGKIKMFEDWILITNKQKHQPISNNIKDNANKAIIKHFEENKHIIESMNSKPLISPFVAPYQTLPEIEIEIEREIEIESHNLADKSAGNNLGKQAKELLDYFFVRYKELSGEEPIITSWSRYNKTAQKYIKLYGIEKMKKAVEAYFSSDDRFIKSNNYSINIFLTDNNLQKIWSLI